ncbi:MAG: hypothetical protein OJF61_001281 [Rhodanobacteraceae bacterium]|nr:MAG: hypothetical protein OJF61_001281 [Rhodanobacteraceae bacterium]
MSVSSEAAGVLQKKLTLRTGSPGRVPTGSMPIMRRAAT